MVKLDIWLVIALTARLDSRGATTTALAVTVLKAALGVLLRMSWTRSCPRWEVAVVSPVEPSSTMVVGLAVIATEVASATSSLGSVARLVALHLGHAATAVVIVVIATRLPLPPGLVQVVLVLAPVLVLVALTIKVAAIVTAVPHHGPLLLQLLELRTAMETMELVMIRLLLVMIRLLLVTIRLLLVRAMVLPVMVLPAMALLQLLPALPLVLALCFKTMGLLEVRLLHLHRHLVQYHRLLRVTFLLHLRQAMSLLRPHLPREECTSSSLFVVICGIMAVGFLGTKAILTI